MIPAGSQEGGHGQAGDVGRPGRKDVTENTGRAVTPSLISCRLSR